MTDFNVLVSSASNKASIFGILNSVRLEGLDIGIYAGDNDPLAPVRNLADFIELPTTRDDNWEQILEILTRLDIGLVIPTRDKELIFWSSHADALRQCGIRVAVSSQSALRVSLDKFAFSLETKDMRPRTIPTFLNPKVVDSSEIVVKERFGSGATNVAICKSASDAVRISSAFTNPIFQPRISGSEISVDAFFGCNNELVGFVTRKRLRVDSGESTVTETFRHAELDNSLKEYFEALGRKFKFFGPVVLQLFITEENTPFVIEMNPRFGGASSVSNSVGLRSLEWLVRWAALEIKHFDFIRTPFELEQTRMPFDILRRSSSNL